MHKWKRNNTYALLLSVAIHAVVAALLLFIVLPKVSHAEEGGGVLVNIGDIDLASGTFTPTPFEPAPSATPPATSTETETDALLTQEDTEAPVIQTPKKSNTDQDRLKAQEAERKRRKAQEAEAARQQREAAEKRRQDAIRQRVSGAFGNASKQQGSGDAESGTGKQGSADGNVESGGANQGIGGFGSFDLTGRSTTGRGLQRPTYTTQIEGRITVRITVSPDGRVIAASIAPGTNIDNASMREGALRAARATTFNRIEGQNNQTGTITYIYKLK